MASGMTGPLREILFATDLSPESRRAAEYAVSLARLGGRYAHVLSESVDSKHDAVSCEAWLHGAFTYMLSR